MRGLFIKGQMKIVDVRAFIGLLLRQGNHPSKFFEPEGLHAAEAHMTDVASLIKVTLARGTSDNIFRRNEIGVIKLVKELFRSKVSALARMPIDPIPWQSIKKLAG